jgi:hypothetical protein
MAYAQCHDEKLAEEVVAAEISPATHARAPHIRL